MSYTRADLTLVPHFSLFSFHYSLPMERPTLYLLDAYALIFRAYYAFLRAPRINSKGLNTSAMFGFVNALEEVLRNRKPSHIAVCFDHKSPNVRVQEFP